MQVLERIRQDKTKYEHDKNTGIIRRMPMAGTAYTPAGINPMMVVMTIQCWKSCINYCRPK